MRFLLRCQKTTYLLINRLEWTHHKHIQCNSSHHRPLNPFSIHSHPRIFPPSSFRGFSTTEQIHLNSDLQLCAEKYIHSFSDQQSRIYYLARPPFNSFGVIWLASLSIIPHRLSIYLFLASHQRPRAAVVGRSANKFISHHLIYC